MPDIKTQLQDSPIVRIHQNILRNKELIHKKDYTFFNIEMIEKAAKHCVLQKACPERNKNLEELEKLSEEFPELLKTIGGRREFTNRLDKITKHLRVVHNIYPRNYMRNVYIALAMFTGLGVIGLTKLLGGYVTFLWASLVLGTGLIIGWIAGTYEERKIAKENRYL